MGEEIKKVQKKKINKKIRYDQKETNIEDCIKRENNVMKTTKFGVFSLNILRTIDENSMSDKKLVNSTKVEENSEFFERSLNDLLFRSKPLTKKNSKILQKMKNSLLIAVQSKHYLFFKDLKD